MIAVCLALLFVWPVLVLYVAMNNLHPGCYSLRDALAVFCRILVGPR